MNTKFKMTDDIEKLYENVESNPDDKLSGTKSSEGLIIPEENQKVFNWLKKEFDKKQIVAKVDISTTTFNPHNLEATTIKDTKPEGKSDLPSTNLPSLSGGITKSETSSTDKDTSEEKSESKEKAKVLTVGGKKQLAFKVNTKTTDKSSTSDKDDDKEEKEEKDNE